MFELLPRFQRDLKFNTSTLGLILPMVSLGFNTIYY